MRIKKIILRVSIIAATLVFIPVIGEFFVELARQGGLYSNPTDKLGQAISLITYLTNSTIFQFVFPLIVGFAAGAWTLYFLQRDRTKEQVKLSPTKYNQEYINRTISLDGQSFEGCKFSNVTFR